MRSSYLLRRINRIITKPVTSSYLSSFVYPLPNNYPSFLQTMDPLPSSTISLFSTSSSSSSGSSSSSSLPSTATNNTDTVIGSSSTVLSTPSAVLSNDTVNRSSSSNSSSSSFSSSSILNLDDFTLIQQEMVQEDEKRESIIKRSRDLLKLSKQTIYETHRQGYSKAQDMINNAQFIAKELIDSVKDFPQLRYGALSNALEEYTEAIIFYQYLQFRTIPRLSDIPYINKEEYLGGLMDFTGELNRYAVLRATARDISAVHHARDTLDIINAQLMLFDFRNGNLRRKYDGVKYTLRKLEQIIYELTLANSSVIVPKSGNMDEKIMASLGSASSAFTNEEDGLAGTSTTIDGGSGSMDQGMMNDDGSKGGDNEYSGGGSGNRGRRGGMHNGGGNKRFRQ